MNTLSTSNYYTTFNEYQKGRKLTESNRNISGNSSIPTMYTNFPKLQTTKKKVLGLCKNSKSNKKFYNPITTSTNFGNSIEESLNKTNWKLLSFSNNNNLKLSRDNKDSKIYITAKDELNKNINSNSLVNPMNFKQGLDNLDELNVKKLTSWETDNLQFKKENYESIYNHLHSLYSSSQNKQKLNDLNNLKRVLLMSEGINKKLEKIGGGKNKIIENLVDKQKREENAIILNSISKSTSKYGKSNKLLLERENNFGIKLESVSEDNTKGIFGENIIGDNGNEEGSECLYRRVINDKTRHETNMRKDLMELATKIYNKKEEKNKLVIELNKIYDDIKLINNEFNKKKKVLDKDIDLLKDAYERRQKILIQKNSANEDIFENTFTQTSQIRSVEHDLFLLNKERTQKIDKLNERKNILFDRLKINNEELDYLKYIYHLMVKETQEYYYQILKNGYDVRYDGLIWVIKHLLEMNAVLEYHHFPKYLSHEHINYLIFMSKLGLEENLMTLILTCLQNKQKNKRLEKNNEKFNMMHEMIVQNENKKNNNDGPHYNEYLIEKNNNKNDEQNLSNIKNLNNKSKICLHSNLCLSKRDMKSNIQEISKFYITNKDQKFDDINSRIYFMFNNIKDKYKDAFKYFDDKKMDEENLNKIIEKIKEELMFSKIDSDQNENVLAKFLENNADNRQDFEMIIYLRERIKDIKNMKDKLKKEMHKKIKESNEELKIVPNQQTSLRNELIYSALFGSHCTL